MFGGNREVSSDAPLQRPENRCELKLFLHPLREYQQPTKGSTEIHQPISEERENIDRLKGTKVRFSDYTTVREYVKIPTNCNTRYWHQHIASSKNCQLVSRVRQ